MSTTSVREFDVVVWSKEDEFKAISIKRNRDGKHFTVGSSFVTNGTAHKGYIKSFSFTEGILFVNTDYSDIGIAFDDIEECNLPRPLPSAAQMKQMVFVTFKDESITATVIGVHFFEGKVKYDLKLWLKDMMFTRIYNVDSAFITVPPKE